MIKSNEQYVRLVMVRHAETEWNLAGKLQGWRDSRLTLAGRKALSSFIARNNIPRQYPADIVYSSDLGRALASARIICNKSGGYIVPDQRLRERRFGILEGKQKNVCINGFLHARHWFAYQGRYEKCLDACLAIATELQAESETAFERRVVDFLRALVRRHAGKTIYVVSHGEWIRCANNILHGRTSWAYGQGIPMNTEMNIFELKPPQLNLSE
ncbi:histidine phosphatase family protein [Photobacterium swingsii]|uniref:Histidine phosphatase family protein n=1 Tax=Photobacterium swingsii TaxID=680026 RepID=A0A2T3PAG0_9GAMM|nr:histidine phosphatase family protein [Photobacterium swingsii]PSW25959.1 histidine phosphatase family protein [Photobacterium swingsii]